MELASISVITWDASWRESYHTIDTMKQMDYPAHKLDFTWVDYYGPMSSEVESRLDGAVNFQSRCLCGEGPWHVGRCMNEGISATSGEILVLMDGDLVVAPDFLRRVAAAHSRSPGSAIYARRWDEPQGHCRNGIGLEYLQRVCCPFPELNFGGCLTIERRVLLQVGGYEEHPVFGGPGAISKELATRLRNKGIPVVWLPDLRVYHPWHPGTGPSTNTTQQRRQKWVISKRSQNVDWEANASQVDEYLVTMPAPEIPGRPDLPREQMLRRVIRRINKCVR